VAGPGDFLGGEQAGGTGANDKDGFHINLLVVALSVAAASTRQG
jgi:hypothetical protein